MHRASASVKTLHLTNAYHPTSGGIRRFYRAMLEAADAEGREMVLVVPSDRTATEQVGRSRVYHVRAPRAPIVDRRYRILFPGTFLAPSGAIARILRLEQPSLLEVCDKYSLFYVAGVLRRFRVPGVKRPTLVGLSCERFDDNLAVTLGRGRFRAKWASWYIGAVYVPQFDVHLANSAYTARELLDAMRPGHRRPVHIVPMGIDIPAVRDADERSKARSALLGSLGAAAETKLLLYVGRLGQEKNLSLLIDTLEHLPDTKEASYRLAVVGDGPMKNTLQDLAARGAEGRVHHLEHVEDRQELARLYAACDVFVHPNPREPFGIAPLEAMAAGLPLVAPAQGGVQTYASRDNAWLTSPDGSSFAAAIRSALSDPTERADRVRRAKHTAAEYGWRSVTKRVFALYDQLHAHRLATT